MKATKMNRNFSFIFLYLVYSIIHKGIIIAKNEKGVCSSKTAEKECCNNYYQENGLCKVCPSGWFGKNCSQQCPKNTYGELCDRSCNCKSNETCNHAIGCLPKIGVCLGKKGEFGCCLNYYQRIKNKCSVCNPGTYGKNCSEQCPNETYGYQCGQKCNCSVNITCDKQFGCVDQDCPPGKFGMKCKDECPVGMFGKFCTGKCQCKSGCDKRFGCPRKASSNSSFHTGRLLLIVFPTIVMAIALAISILTLKIRGVNLCQKCNDYSPNNKEKKETVSVSNIVYKGNKAKEGKKRCQSETRTLPIIDSMNDLEKAPGSFDEGGSNGEMEAGVYNTLTLRVTGYVEPSTWTRHSITDIYSDSSSTCSRTKVLGDSLSSGEMTSDERLYRDASICLQKSENRNKSMQTFQQEGIDYRENRTDSVSINSEDGYVFDETVQEDMGMAGELRQKNFLMKELSSQLMNINKN